jgi:hypothetical protein
MNIIKFIREHFGPIKTNTVSSSYERKPFNVEHPAPEIIKNGPFLTGCINEKFFSYAASGCYYYPVTGVYNGDFIK